MYPTSIIARQDVPSSPVASTFIIRSQYNPTGVETSVTNIHSREYQLIYYGSSSVDVLTQFDAIDHAIQNSRMMIPLRSSSRFIRVKGFYYGTVYTSASGVPYSIGVLQTETRDLMDIPETEKIMAVNTTVNGE
jgi:hypothetical protein